MSKKSLGKPALPLSAIGNGILFRAVVSLPSHMTEADQPLQDRIVFFESPTIDGPARHLESLLSYVWCMDTQDWCEQGYIYNIWRDDELRRNSFNSGPASDLHLFEIGAGGQGIEAIGKDRIHYARAGRVDLFVTPKVAGRLRDLLETIELLYQEEAAHRRT